MSASARGGARSPSKNAETAVGGERAHEFGNDAAVAERFHRRDARDTESLRHLTVRIDVDLDELDRTSSLLDLAVEYRTEGSAGCAPLRPEVDNYRDGRRAIDHLRLEGCVSDIHPAHDTEAPPLRCSP